MHFITIECIRKSWNIFGGELLLDSTRKRMERTMWSNWKLAKCMDNKIIILLNVFDAGENVSLRLPLEFAKATIVATIWISVPPICRYMCVDFADAERDKNNIPHLLRKCHNFKIISGLPEIGKLVSPFYRRVALAQFNHLSRFTYFRLECEITPRASKWMESACAVSY